MSSDHRRTAENRRQQPEVVLSPLDTFVVSVSENADREQKNSRSAPVPNSRIAMRPPARQKSQKGRRGNQNEKKTVKAMVPKAHHCTDRKKADHKRRQKAVRKAKGRQTNTKTIPPVGLHLPPRKRQRALRTYPRLERERQRRTRAFPFLQSRCPQLNASLIADFALQLTDP